jgi:hypothetical protein
MARYDNGDERCTSGKLWVAASGSCPLPLVESFWCVYVLALCGLGAGIHCQMPLLRCVLGPLSTFSLQPCHVCVGMAAGFGAVASLAIRDVSVNVVSGFSVLPARRANQTRQES